MNVMPLQFGAGVKPDPIDPGILYVADDAAPGLIHQGDTVKAWVREYAVAPRARRCALLMSPDAILNLHDAVDQTLARPLPSGEDGEPEFRTIFRRHNVPQPIIEALVDARALFYRETGYWPGKIISRCHIPFDVDDTFHIVERAHFDSYDDASERFVMILVLAGNGPILIRNPRTELPSGPPEDLDAFSDYAQGLKRRFGAIRVRPGSVVLKKANHRGSRAFFDTLPHLSGKVSNWPFWGKRVAFTIS